MHGFALHMRISSLRCRFWMRSGAEELNKSAKHTFRSAAIVSVLLVCALFAAMLVVHASGSGSRSCTERDIVGTTSGPSYTEPSAIMPATFDASQAVTVNDCAIDISHCAQGYIGAAGKSSQRLKLQVSCGQMSYNYDVPQNGMAIIVPVNMGDGLYNISLLENVGGSQYVPVVSTSTNVVLANEFAPYVRPNVFCDYTEKSACVQKARELAANADNEGDVARAIYQWMVNTIKYDDAKAKELSGKGGYVPDPDETLTSEMGICFDYASLAAAMFRSLGIPCQIVTGNVAPEDVYHAWNMIYLDGAWRSVLITVDPDEWTRIDLTFAASETAATYEDEELMYTERYRY